jgi:hypothetical protein
VQDGRGYKINPLAERVIAMYDSRVREEADKQKALEAPITTEPPQQLELRKTQTSTKNKTMLNKLRDL